MPASEKTWPMRAIRRPAHDLTGRERRHLRALAHHLTPVVQIGKEGVTDSVRRQVDRALDDHELIKVRVGEGCPEDRFAVGDVLAKVLGAHVAGLVGRVIVLYRMHPDKPRIHLPGP